MPKLQYNKKTFIGIDQSAGVTSGNMIRCENFDYGYDFDTDNYLVGFLKKPPKLTQLGDKVSTSTCIGMFLFVPSNYAISDTKKILQAFSDGTVRYLLSTTAWTTIKSGYLIYLPMSFTSYNDYCFWSNGQDKIAKWKENWATSVALKDITLTPTVLTGSLTFTEDSTALSATGGAFLTELSIGDLVHASSTATEWYEIQSITDNDNAVLSIPFNEATVTGSATAGKSADALIRGRHILVWNDRLYVMSGNSASLPTVGTTKVGSITELLP